MKKKVIFSVIVLLGVFLFVGCGKESHTLQIDLEANATTGYEWSYKTSDVLILEVTEDEYKPDKTDEEITGVGGIQHYLFTAKEPGKTTLTFTYKQPWATEDEDPIEISYEVVVDKKLNVEVTKSSGKYFEDEIIPQPVIK